MAGISGSGPTVLRIMLGMELRRLREKAGLTPHLAGKAIRSSESKISRMERGRHAFKQEDVEDLLFTYDVTDPEVRDQLLSLSKRANQPGWWHSYHDVLPNWFQLYVGLEQAASRIRTYEPQYIPGLLQTEEYAAEVIALGDFGPEEVERRVAFRTARQRRLHEGGVRVWAVVDEAALRRPFGDRDVMRDQLEKLIAAAKLPSLSLQVAPFAAGGHAVPSGFSVMRFRDPQLPDIVYVEQLTNALYLDKRDEADAYTLAIDRLSVTSPTPGESLDIVAGILDAM